MLVHEAQQYFKVPSILPQAGRKDFTGCKAPSAACLVTKGVMGNVLAYVSWLGIERTPLNADGLHLVSSQHSAQKGTVSNNPAMHVYEQLRMYPNREKACCCVLSGPEVKKEQVRCLTQK